jgi:3-phosphoglycerate kinase
MLENVRLWVGEEGKVSGQRTVISEQESQTTKDMFARELSQLGDIYVNEAFGESHRDVASITGIPNYLPAYAGLWLV